MGQRNKKCQHKYSISVKTSRIPVLSSQCERPRLHYGAATYRPGCARSLETGSNSADNARSLCRSRPRLSRHFMPALRLFPAIVQRQERRGAPLRPCSRKREEMPGNPSAGPPQLFGATSVPCPRSLREARQLPISGVRPLLRSA